MSVPETSLAELRRDALAEACALCAVVAGVAVLL
jgi:hypothetical protein